LLIDFSITCALSLSLGNHVGNGASAITMETGLPLITSASKKITDEEELPDSFFLPAPPLSTLPYIFPGKKEVAGRTGRLTQQKRGHPSVAGICHNSIFLCYTTRRLSDERRTVTHNGQPHLTRDIVWRETLPTTPYPQPRFAVSFGSFDTRPPDTRVYIWFSMGHLLA